MQQPTEKPLKVLVSQARPFLFCSTNHFQYAARVTAKIFSMLLSLCLAVKGMIHVIGGQRLMIIKVQFPYTAMHSLPAVWVHKTLNTYILMKQKCFKA